MRDYGLLFVPGLFANYSATVVYFVATVIIKYLLNNMLREENKYEKGTHCKRSRK